MLPSSVCAVIGTCFNPSSREKILGGQVGNMDGRVDLQNIAVKLRINLFRGEHANKFRRNQWQVHKSRNVTLEFSLRA